MNLKLAPSLMDIAMYFFNRVTFSQNMYRIRRNHDDFHAEVLCMIHTDMYTDNGKHFVDLIFEKNAFVEEIHNLENAIESNMGCVLNNKLLHVTKDTYLLKRVKLPFKYDRIDIPIYDIHDHKLTSDEIKPQTQCTANLLANYVYTHNKKGGITWSIQKIVKC